MTIANNILYLEYPEDLIKGTLTSFNNCVISDFSIGMADGNFTGALVTFTNSEGKLQSKLLMLDKDTPPVIIRKRRTLTHFKNKKANDNNKYNK